MTRLHAALAVDRATSSSPCPRPRATAQRFTSRAVGVRVDVLVTNGQQLVRGLDARDFELRDNGVIQIRVGSRNRADSAEPHPGVRYEQQRRRRADALSAASGRGLARPIARSGSRGTLVVFVARPSSCRPDAQSATDSRRAVDSSKRKAPHPLRDAAFAGLALGRTILVARWS